tara:strand:+ start:267 stop:716 length:450 start_codon:yes stop_codon:yes gene_type:complete
MITTAILIVISILIIMASLSESSPPPRDKDSILEPCPDKPNCVCSEYIDDTEHYIDPLALSTEKLPRAVEYIKISIESLGGEIQTENNDYLAATFSSSFFGFIDDVEFRIDTENKLIHIRSAARLGHSDFGVNKKRVKTLKMILRQQLG